MSCKAKPMLTEPLATNHPVIRVVSVAQRRNQSCPGVTYARQWTESSPKHRWSDELKSAKSTCPTNLCYERGQRSL